MSEHFPAVSEISVTNGIWFVFPAEGKVIRAWGSSVSGLERIYVDDAVVSEHRSAGRGSEHYFLVDGDQYSISFNVKGRLRTDLECVLAKDGVPIKTFIAKYDMTTVSSPKRLVMSLFAGVLIGIAGLYFRLPLWGIVALLAVVVLVQGQARKKNSGIKIEEVAAQPAEGRE